MDLHDLLEQVKDQESFLVFVGALVENWEDAVQKEKLTPGSTCGRGANGWENGTIGAYLDAALRWAETTRMGQTQGLPAEPNWKAFALFLYSGKIYE
jgi:hypothetical protein